MSNNSYFNISTRKAIDFGENVKNILPMLFRHSKSQTDKNKLYQIERPCTKSNPAFEMNFIVIIGPFAMIKHVPTFPSRI